jgi:hypothetical protein
MSNDAVESRLRLREATGTVIPLPRLRRQAGDGGWEYVCYQPSLEDARVVHWDPFTSYVDMARLLEAVVPPCGSAKTLALRTWVDANSGEQVAVVQIFDDEREVVSSGSARGELGLPEAVSLAICELTGIAERAPMADKENE